MSDVAIRVENLSKLYRIGAKQENYKTLRDQIANRFNSLFHRNGHGTSVSGHRSSVIRDNDTIWALKDISFEVKEGEVVGIIGRNGAGKSTLLKVLSRITEPTQGFARVYGRVGSLLEVGTGFHQELTGTENIYLNGAILGMNKAEIDRKFDEIVAFAEVERFIHTPVKHFSSGMYLRLAFSVAAHLEPQILVIDEVLTVGDAAFQKKCLGKMSDAAQSGRTVLFVSHNMSAIHSLCDRAILIEEGKVRHDGDVFSAISKYHDLVRSGDTHDQHGIVTFTNIRLNGQHSLSLESAEPIELTFTLNLNVSPTSARLWCIIQDAAGTTVLHHRIEHYELFKELKRGHYQITVRIPGLWLRPGVYTLHFKALIAHMTGGKERHVSDLLIIDVQPSNGMFVDLSSMIGLLSPPVTWSAESIN